MTYSNRWPLKTSKTFRHRSSYYIGAGSKGFRGKKLHKKLCFPLWISSLNVTKSAGNCRLVTFTKELLNGKLPFLCTEMKEKQSNSYSHVQ